MRKTAMASSEADLPRVTFFDFRFSVIFAPFSALTRGGADRRPPWPPGGFPRAAAAYMRGVRCPHGYRNLIDAILTLCVTFLFDPLDPPRHSAIQAGPVGCLGGHTEK